MRRPQLRYSVLPSATEAPPNFVRPCIRLRKTPFAPFGEEGRTARQERQCGLERIYFKGGGAPHRNMDYKEGIYFGLEHHILMTPLQESPLVSLLESF